MFSKKPACTSWVQNQIEVEGIILHLKANHICYSCFVALVYKIGIEDSLI
jgi:hypothetical protein